MCEFPDDLSRSIAENPFKYPSLFLTEMECSEFNVLMALEQAKEINTAGIYLNDTDTTVDQQKINDIVNNLPIEKTDWLAIHRTTPSHRNFYRTKR